MRKITPKMIQAPKKVTVTVGERGFAEDAIIELGIAYGISSIKNPERKKKLRNINLKYFRSLKVAYAGDPDFE